MPVLRYAFVCVVLLSAAGANAKTPPAPAQPATAKPAAKPATTATTATTTAPVNVPAPALDASRGLEIGLVFESWMTPWQEADEEESTPSSTPKQFRSTGTSMSRAAREAAGHRAHGQLRFSKDMSRVWVDIKIEGIKADTVNMFHIHCGKPGILGPIAVDFATATNIQENLADGMFSVEIRNEHIVKTVEHGHGSLVGAFTAGCVIPSPSLGSVKPLKMSTVAGLARLAMDGELYFNLHTTSQTYFGDIRGQLHPAR